MIHTFQMVALLCLITLGSAEAFACSCVEPSLRQRFRDSSEVFLGKVIEFRELTSAEENKDLEFFFYRVVFEVEKQWKGQKRMEIDALANFDAPGMCNDIDLSVGRRLLVFAVREHGELLVYRECGPSASTESDITKGEIKKLGGLFFRMSAFLFQYPKF